MALYLHPPMHKIRTVKRKSKPDAMKFVRKTFVRKAFARKTFGPNNLLCRLGDNPCQALNLLVFPIWSVKLKIQNIRKNVNYKMGKLLSKNELVMH